MGPGSRRHPIRPVRERLLRPEPKKCPRRGAGGAATLHTGKKELSILRAISLRRGSEAAESDAMQL